MKNLLLLLTLLTFISCNDKASGPASGASPSSTALLKSWKDTVPAELIEDDASVQGSLQIGFKGDGSEMMVLWNRGNYTDGLEYYLSHYKNGAWIHPADATDLITPSGAGISDPHLVMSANGDAMLYWSEDTNTDSFVHSKMYVNGSWRSVAQLTIYADVVNDIYAQFSVETNAQGNFSIVQFYDQKLYFSQFVNGSWSSMSELKFQDNSSMSFFAPFIEFKVADNKNVLVVIGDEDYSTFGKLYRAEYKAGSWITPSDISDAFHVEDQAYAGVRLATNGSHSVILWGNADNHDLRMTEYRGTSWSTPSVVDSGSRVFYNQVLAMDSSGKTMIAWEGSTDIKTQYYNGTSWAAPRVLAPKGSSVLTADLVSLAGGEMFFARTDYETVYQTKCLAGVCAAETVLSSTSSSGKPWVEIYSSSKEVVVIWEYQKLLDNGDLQGRIHSTEIEKDNSRTFVDMFMTFVASPI